MSTRAAVEFSYRVSGSVSDVVALVYVHSDGYPAGLGVELLDFMDEVDKLDDKRFGDPSYLAAKFVVYKSMQGACPEGTLDALNFLGVGVIQDIPGDVEYIYTVTCSDYVSKPTVSWRRYSERVWERRDLTRATVASDGE